MISCPSACHEGMCRSGGTTPGIINLCTNVFVKKSCTTTRAGLNFTHLIVGDIYKKQN